MPIFQIQSDKLVPIEEKKIDLEKDIQKITETNLSPIFGLNFIRSEFTLQNLRIDTLAFNEETQSFAIIEFKRDRSFSVVDQGFAYLSLMLNNKDSFVLEYARNTNKNINEINIDWSQSKVIFIANSFTSYQQNAVNFKDLPIELWEVKKYNNNTILFNELKSPESSESIKSISKNETIEKVSKEVKHYSVEDHFRDDWAQSREIFDELRKQIFELDNRIEESPQKYYIGYKIGRLIVLAIHIYKSKVVIDLPRFKPQDLKDPESHVVYQKNSFKYYNKHISEFVLTSVGDIAYAMFIAKQVYNKFVKP